MEGVTIGTTRMASQTSGATAEWDPGAGAWTSARLPGRRLTRDQAAALVMLAELESLGYGASPAAAALRRQLGTP